MVPFIFPGFIVKMWNKDCKLHVELPNWNISFSFSWKNHGIPWKFSKNNIQKLIYGKFPILNLHGIFPDFVPKKIIYLVTFLIFLSSLSILNTDPWNSSKSIWILLILEIFQRFYHEKIQDFHGIFSCELFKSNYFALEIFQNILD